MKSERNAFLIVALVAIGAAQLSASDRRPLGEIDFFGYKGLDIAAVRAALPFHEGDSFPPAKVHSDALKRQVGAAIKQAIGREPTDVSFVCCDCRSQDSGRTVSSSDAIRHLVRSQQGFARPCGSDY